MPMKYKPPKRLGNIFILIAISAVFLLPETAMATPWDSTSQQILAIFTGGLTRTIAIRLVPEPVHAFNTAL